MNSSRNRGTILTNCFNEAIRNLSCNICVFDELESTAVWGKLYKKSVIEKLRFNEKMNIGEDFIFNYFAICNAKTITYCSLKLYIYNFIETSLMHSEISSPRLMQSFCELVGFEASQRNTNYSEDLIVRCINIAFTMYLKVSEKQYEEKQKIEKYICENRNRVLKNKFAGRKVKMAVCISYVGFGFLRKVYKWVSK